jgi:hypothetical protein
MQEPHDTAVADEEIGKIDFLEAAWAILASGKDL